MKHNAATFLAAINSIASVGEPLPLQIAGAPMSNLAFILDSHQSGKTLSLVDVAARAMVADLPVLFITLEATESDIANRIRDNLAERDTALGYSDGYDVVQFMKADLELEGIAAAIRHCNYTRAPLALVCIDDLEILSATIRFSENLQDLKRCDFVSRLNELALRENVAIVSSVSTRRRHAV
jgi:thymidine kinase